MYNWQEVNIDNLAGGDAKEKLNFAIREVIENCRDLNRPHKVKRVAILKIVFEVKENRRDIDVTAQASTKLVPDKPCQDNLALDDEGNAYTNSAHQMDMGRAVLDGAVQTMRKNATIPVVDNIDEETGEVL